MECPQALPTLFQLGTCSVLCVLFHFPTLCLDGHCFLLLFTALALLLLASRLNGHAFLLAAGSLGRTRRTLCLLFRKKSWVVFLGQRGQLAHALLLRLFVLFANPVVFADHPSLLLAALRLFKILQLVPIGLGHHQRIPPRLEAEPEVVKAFDFLKRCLGPSDVRYWTLLREPRVPMEDLPKNLVEVLAVALLKLRKALIEWQRRIVQLTLRRVTQDLIRLLDLDEVFLNLLRLLFAHSAELVRVACERHTPVSFLDFVSRSTFGNSQKRIERHILQQRAQLEDAGARAAFSALAIVLLAVCIALGIVGSRAAGRLLGGCNGRRFKTLKEWSSSGFG
mmetsp:Transcript_8964/g.23355  ORF Transcript_8964/g.23355 Transcript_8964/m.23355 type:complete len:337 (-) Transcript_8964:245-1255(-)